MRSSTVTLALLTLAASGCASLELARPGSQWMAPSSTCHHSRPTAKTTRVTPSQDAPSQDLEAGRTLDRSDHGAVVTAAYVSLPEDPTEEIPAGRRSDVIELEQVVESVYRSFPLLEAALLTRDRAFGEHLAAQGAFDLKLKATTENGPLGFYQTYRQSIGVEQPTFRGGALFGGYRLGRGNFQPWYGERQTNDGGEFRTGVAVPLARNVNIDARRAELWRTDLDRQLAEPEIRLQLIDFVREASHAYWEWVAAGRRQQIAASLLKIAEDRNDAIRRKVETGDTEPPVLQDNRRLIVSREAKLIDAQRKRQQTAIKLSLFYRDDQGQPLVAEESQFADFATPPEFDENALDADVQAAIANRPELLAMDLLREQLEIDLAQARNELLPEIQAVVVGIQDVGGPTSKKKDKSPYELEAGLFLEVPVQRRKARGKMTAVEGKLGQLAAKRRMTADKITTEVTAVYAALLAAYKQITRAHESAELAVRLAEIERRKFALGESDLLSVNLREQQAAEAQSTEVDALYEYFAARADYHAILARD